MLGDHNWHPYRDSILEQSSEYGLCGLALKSGVPVALVEPAESDKKNKATKAIITEAQFIALLVTRTGHLDPEDDADEIAAIDEALADEYAPAYPTDHHFGAAFKKFIRQSERVEEDGPNLFSLLLSTMLPTQKDAVKADPAYQAAFEVNDYMRLFQLQNKIFDSQGDYTSVAIRGEYSAYTMIGHEEISYDQYVIGFNRLLARMRELGIVMDPIDITLQFLHRIRPEPETEGWDLKIGTLLCTMPVPTLLVATTALANQRKFADSRSKVMKSVSERERKPKPRADPLVLAYDRQAKDYDAGGKPERLPTICINCGKPNHKGPECRRPPAKCGKCKQTGHCTEQHDLAVRIKEAAERRNPKGGAAPKKVHTKALATVESDSDFDEQEASDSYLTLSSVVRKVDPEPSDDSASDADDESEDFDIAEPVFITEELTAAQETARFMQTPQSLDDGEMRRRVRLVERHGTGDIFEVVAVDCDGRVLEVAPIATTIDPRNVAGAYNFSDGTVVLTDSDRFLSQNAVPGVAHEGMPTDTNWGHPALGWTADAPTTVPTATLSGADFLSSGTPTEPPGTDPTEPTDGLSVSAQALVARLQFGRPSGQEPSSPPTGIPSREPTSPPTREPAVWGNPAPNVPSSPPTGIPTMDPTSTDAVTEYGVRLQAYRDNRTGFSVVIREADGHPCYSYTLMMSS